MLTDRADVRLQPMNGLATTGLESEADARTRTADPFITSEVLYQLSYVGGVGQCSAVGAATIAGRTTSGPSSACASERRARKISVSTADCESSSSLAISR